MVEEINKGEGEGGESLGFVVDHQQQDQESDMTTMTTKTTTTTTTAPNEMKKDDDNLLMVVSEKAEDEEEGDDDDDDVVLAVEAATATATVEVEEMGEGMETVYAEPVILLQTKIRHAVSPYLPPPLIRTMNRIVDPMLEPYVGQEASMTLLGTFLLGFFVWIVVIRGGMMIAFGGNVGAHGGGGGNGFLTHDGNKNRRRDKKNPTHNTALAVDESDDYHVLTESLRRRPFTDSIILCGPTGGGKTRLFYRLCHGHESSLKTVTSLRPNVGFFHPTITTPDEKGRGQQQQQQQPRRQPRHNGGSHDGPQNGQNNDDDVVDVDVDDHRVLRYVDYPGHMDLSPMLDELRRSRIVLVIDSTQPVSIAADMLHQLLEAAANHPRNPKDIPPRRRRRHIHHHHQHRNHHRWSILIASNKSDLSNSKNWKRIKIQLRTELERILRVQHQQYQSSSSSSSLDNTHGGIGNSDDDGITTWTNKRCSWWPPPSSDPTTNTSIRSNRGSQPSSSSPRPLPPPPPLVWEDITVADISFLSTSCDGDDDDDDDDDGTPPRPPPGNKTTHMNTTNGISELEEFCLHGTIPNQSLRR